MGADGAAPGALVSLSSLVVAAACDGVSSAGPTMKLASPSGAVGNITLRQREGSRVAANETVSGK